MTTINPTMLRQVALFRALDDRQLTEVGALVRERQVSSGTIIFHQGDSGDCLYLIRAGRVRIFLTSLDGREITIRIYGHNTSFGEFAVLDGEPRTASAIAVTDVTALVLYRQDFLRLLRENFALVERVIAQLTERLRYTTSYSEQLAFLSVPGRVAALLVHLSGIEPDMHRREPAVQRTIHLELTQQELAEFVNTSREWINRALRDFAQQGLIRLERGRVIVLDLAGLQQHVQ